MTKSPSKKRAVPKMGNLGGVREISKKLKGSDVIFENREQIAEALMGLATAKITDILDWDDEGNVQVMNPSLSGRSELCRLVIVARCS